MFSRVIRLLGGVCVVTFGHFGESFIKGFLVLDLTQADIPPKRVGFGRVKIIDLKQTNNCYGWNKSMRQHDTWRC